LTHRERLKKRGMGEKQKKGERKEDSNLVKPKAENRSCVLFFP